MHLQEVELVIVAPLGELAEVERVRVAGQAGVPDQEPGKHRLFLAREPRDGSDEWVAGIGHDVRLLGVPRPRRRFPGRSPR
jgi:hypothetical protein